MSLIRIFCLLCALYLVLVGSVFALKPSFSMVSEGEQLEMVYFNKGNAYYNQGNYKAALDAYDMVLKINRNITEAWFNKGQTLYKLERYDESIKALDMAISTRPDYAKAWNIKGLVLKKLGNDTEAKAAIDMAKKLNATSSLQFQSDEWSPRQAQSAA